MKDVLKGLQEKCAQTKQEVISEAIKHLLKVEQLAVEACFQAAKVKQPRGVRNNRQWVYECILLRIKSPGGYKHLRNHKILALPSLQTLDRCMRRMKSSYGFDENVFKALKVKTEKINETDKHGN